MKTSYLVIAMVFSLTGCAGMQLKKEMKEGRGYSDEDIAAIEKQGQDYAHRLVMAGSSVNNSAFDRSSERSAESDIKTIFCKCYAELKDKCREKPDGLTPEQKKLWIKANAAEVAMARAQGPSMVDDPSKKLDPDTCPSTVSAK